MGKISICTGVVLETYVFFAAQPAQCKRRPQPRATDQNPTPVVRIVRRPLWGHRRAASFLLPKITSPSHQTRKGFAVQRQAVEPKSATMQWNKHDTSTSRFGALFVCGTALLPRAGPAPSQERLVEFVVRAWARRVCIFHF